MSSQQELFGGEVLDPVLVGAKALHESWRSAFLPPHGRWRDYAGAIKPESLFLWDNIHPQNQQCYLEQSTTVLSAVEAAGLLGNIRAAISKAKGSA